MAHPNIELLGAVYPTVPAVKLPIFGGGTAQFDDTTDADATAADIASGKTAYVNGVKLTGTGGGGGGIIIDDTPDPAGGTIREITAIQISGTYTATTNTSSADISSYQYLDVAVPVGLDLPTFTATMDGGGNISITCDKTYAECRASLIDANNAALLDDGALTGMTVADAGVDYITYEQTSIDSGISISTIAITYHSDNTITFTADNINSRDSTSLLVSGATVTAEAGWYETNVSKAVASGSVAVTSSTATATPSISVSTAGVITAAVSGSKSVGATVTTGYVSSASSGTVTITGSTTSALTTTAGTHITPTTTAQTAVPAYRYTTGSVIVDAIPSEYIVPSGTYTATTNTSSVDIGAYKYLTVNVPGGGKAAQIANGFNRVAATAYTAVTGQSITVGKTGTYDVYWVGYRSSTSGTNGSQLYIGSTAYGTANTSFDGTYTNWQMNHLSNVSLTANQTITVRARSRGTSYYMYIANLTIIES